MQPGEYKGTLRDGTRCVIRLCCHNESGEEQQHLKEGIRSAWCHLSPESRFYRFGYVPRQLSEQQLDYLAKKGIHQDYEKRAKNEIEFESAPQDGSFEDLLEETDLEAESDEPADSFAWLGPVIVQ